MFSGAHVVFSGQNTSGNFLKITTFFVTRVCPRMHRLRCGSSTTDSATRLKCKNLENKYAGAVRGLTSSLSTQGNVIYCAVQSVNAGALSGVQKSLPHMEVAGHYYNALI